MLERLHTPTLPGIPESCWLARAPKPHFAEFSGSIECNVVIVGAGIVGLTTALALIEQGKSVTVLEAREIGAQVTGRSTAKITSQHALIYRHLVDRFGLDLARLYAEANRAGCDQIKLWVERFAIDCDYETKIAYAYSSDTDRALDIVAEVEAARAVGFAASFVEKAPLPFDTAAAIVFPDQAQFNPASYLVQLAMAAQEAGAKIFSSSRACTFAKGSRNWRVETEKGAVDASAVVIATNIPVKSPVGYANRTQPRCHVAMAYRLATGHGIDGMFIGIDDPTHSIRTGRDDEGELLIVLGPKFDTGQDGDVAQRFRDLDSWVRNRLPAENVVWRWCNEDYDTVDRVPYVGEPSPEEAPNYFIATGFNGWGISNGTAAGLSIAHKIVTGTELWPSLYDPLRHVPKDFHRSGDSQSLVESIDDIPNGGGGVVRRGEDLVAVWRDMEGRAHAVSAVCTHKGCTVTWNTADGTWDCPCHGSVFEANGAVIHGPARSALPARDV
jgi:glycine/D-amino acid oxidase-like deaminating enzyme/nitrite reductase/ring-hydroxylating ferredoxin subunit